MRIVWVERELRVARAEAWASVVPGVAAMLRVVDCPMFGIPLATGFALVALETSAGDMPVEGKIAAAAIQPGTSQRLTTAVAG